MNNKYYTFEEFKNFILSQKDDRKIDMQSEFLGIGCLLTQFGRKKYHKKICNVGFSSLVIKGCLIKCFDCPDKITEIIRTSITKNITLYKQAKKILKDITLQTAQR